MTIPTPPGLESLVDLACRDGVDIRPTLLRVLTDLYVQKPTHTAEEERHYVELAQRLMETVDAATRAAVTARLISYRQVPAALRPHLALQVILPETQEPAQAEAAAPAEAAALRSAPASPSAPRPAPAPPPTAAELCELFFTASPQERALILTHLDAVAAQDDGEAGGEDEETVQRLETAALRHDGSAFARAITGALGLDPALARRIVEDETGEPLLIVGRVLRMPAAVLQRVLLFLNPAVGQSVQRVYDLAALYERISVPAARHLLAILRDAAPAPARPAHHAALYQAALWDDIARIAHAEPRSRPAAPDRTDAARRA